MLFGSSGIRSRYNWNLLNTTFHTGSALARTASNIIVGRDTRGTSPLLRQALISGLLASGARVQDTGIAPTPTVAYGARYGDAACMITASHNPEEYNGMKLFNPDGSSFGREQQEELEGFLPLFRWQSWSKQGDLQSFSALKPHRSAILDRVECTSSLRVVLDCGNGAGCLMTPALLKEMGLQVTTVNCNPAPRFARPSEPLPEHFPYLKEIIRKKEARCAIAHDGDADRMVAWDSRGRPIGGDILMMLFASYLGATKVVTTMDASMAIETIAEVRRTPVGDAFVSEQLREWGTFGAEPSGTWIFPEISYCPDGIYAAALFCEMVTEWDIKGEIEKMPRFQMRRESIATSYHREILQVLGATSPTDGVRITEEQGWILIRASGTEPKVRITVEGDSVAVAKELLRKGCAMVMKAKKNPVRKGHKGG